MEDLKEEVGWFRERVRDMLTRDAGWRRWLQIGFVLGGVVVAGVGEVASNYVDNPTLRGFTSAVWVCGLLAAFIGGIVFAMVDVGAPEMAARAQAAIDEANSRGATLRGLTHNFEWMARMYSVSNGLREYVEAVMLQGAGDEEARAVRFGSMLDIVLAEKHVLLGIRDEAWNFAIYLWNGMSLECVVCRRPSRTEEEAPHRSWGPGEGHVGMAWQLAEELVAPDTSDPVVARYFAASKGQRKEEDTLRYRSIAALPIRMQGETPSGVLVATSDKVGRYRPYSPADSGIDNVEPLRILSTSVAMVLRAGQLNEKRSKA